MNYDRIILELMDRVAALEEEVALLKAGKNEEVETQDGFTDNNFEVNGGRDTTKYILDGKRYGKNRLVLAIVKKYVHENDGMTAAKLMMIFDKSLQGSLGVIRTLEDVKNSYSDYERRFFCQPNEIIQTSTGPCVVCTQWGKFNINNLIARAKELGIEITII